MMTNNNRRKMAVFTMDLENFTDTGCIMDSGLKFDQDMLDGLDEYVAILDKYDIKATFFAVCEAAQSVKDRLKKYISNGHDLALHGYDHTAPMKLSCDEFRYKIEAAKKWLEELFDVEVKGYRAPFFSLDNEHLEVLSELGFKYDSSRFDYPKRVHAAEIDVSRFNKLTENVFKRGDFFEFGVPCHHWLGIRIPVAGGGYVRMSDWTFLSSMLTQYLAHSDYYVFYLHPFEVSKMKMPATPHLKGYDQYYLRAGVKNYPHKIERIIKMLQKQGYEFVTFDELCQRLLQGEQIFN
ncbi:MAG: polysaccharide deacetylase family protein [Clostridia bacterium]|nr:polysaccharide deacetylase family protein [Clostridia bacterium]